MYSKVFPLGLLMGSAKACLIGNGQRVSWNGLTVIVGDEPDPGN